MLLVKPSQGATSPAQLQPRLPRTRFEKIAENEGGTVTFIKSWLASHAKGNSCQSCEGLGFLPAVRRPWVRRVPRGSL